MGLSQSSAHSNSFPMGLVQGSEGSVKLVLDSSLYLVMLCPYHLLHVIALFDFSVLTEDRWSF